MSHSNNLHLRRGSLPCQLLRSLWFLIKLSRPYQSVGRYQWFCWSCRWRRWNGRGRRYPLVFIEFRVVRSWWNLYLQDATQFLRLIYGITRPQCVKHKGNVSLLGRLVELIRLWIRRIGWFIHFGRIEGRKAVQSSEIRSVQTPLQH